MLLPECPVCRTPLRWTYLLRTLFSRWPCAHCGSILAIDYRFRILALLIEVVMIFVGGVLLTRAGWSNLLAPLFMLLCFLPILLAIDRAKVVERAGFHCRGCGYDLQGQVTPRCPECGRDFDDEDHARWTSAASLSPRTSRRPAVVALVIMIFLLLLTVLAVGITHYLASLPRTPPTPTSSSMSASAPSSPSPESAAGTP